MVEKVEKKINVDQVVSYLSHAFSKAQSRAMARIGSKAVRTVKSNGEVETTTLYDYQVEFCYLIDEIQRGPAYIVPKIIQDANELIARLDQEGTKVIAHLDEQ
jgi:hypothetical protein